MFAGSLQGKHHAEFAKWIGQAKYLVGTPNAYSLDDKNQPAPIDWLARLQQIKSNGSAFWETERYEIIKGFSYLKGSELIHFYIDQDFTLSGIIAELALVPFEFAVVDSNHDAEWRVNHYRRWGIGRLMSDHGSLMGFRGTGHDRLVSRRWLDFGPWRVIRRPDDTSFVQFHDLDITDPAEAYAQAAPGHERMGNSATGGYLQHQLDWIIKQTKGLYDAKTQSLELVINPGGTVTQDDMLSTCALRLKHRLTIPATDPTRLNTIAYVFLAREDADAHLHELWLRELQCWYVDERGKHRLDDSYHPVPNPPVWVKRLNERDTGQ